MTGTDHERESRFSELFEQLVTAMTSGRSDVVPEIERLLIEISLLLRLSKGVTRVYRNPQEEEKGGGETLSCFDMGEECVEVMRIRVVTSVMNSAEMTVYMSPDAEPLTEWEKARAELVMRTVLSYISRNRLRDIVEELAFYDDDGFRNLRSLQVYIYRRMGTGKLDGMAVLHYNLRHFSLVNKEIGKKYADEVIKNHYLGVDEIVNAKGRVFRLGGDNFVAFCAHEDLDRLLAYLTETQTHFGTNNESVRIGCSVGVFKVPDGFTFNDQGDIMERIISCSHVAQSGGQERIVFYNDSIVIRREKSMRVQQLFPEAIRNEEFRVFYQPKVNIETGELCGAEALCRWFRKNKVIPPGDFIPMLEETNDICRLDFYMLEHVCRDIKRWIEEGRDPVRVSVNLSRKHMMNTDLLGTITGIIDRCGIDHRYIEIELTETTTDVEFNDLKRVVSGLQQVDISTSVDDFGIGYSSLNLISAIPWNVLKVDRSFLPIRDDPQYRMRSVMFRHVIGMAQELGLECIAEGVETQEHLNILRENCCNIAQGFLFDRPLPVDEFEKRLDSRSYTVPE